MEADHSTQALVNNTLLYFIGTGLMRLSIVAFLPRLGKDRKWSAADLEYPLLITRQSTPLYL
jgi:hypothetical protein